MRAMIDYLETIDGYMGNIRYILKNRKRMSKTQYKHVQGELNAMLERTKVLHAYVIDNLGDKPK